MVSDSKSGVDARTGAHAVTTGSRHVFVLSLVLALAYLLTIVYASLQPFRNWRMPAADVYGFLAAPWPRYITLRDVLINIAAYIPLGFMLALGLRRWLRPVVAVTAGALLDVSVSIAMESVQMFLPARIASNLDVLTNGAGGLIGALAAPLFLPSRALGARVAALRDRVFAPGTLTDVGIVVALLWIATHLNPWTQVFGTGHLRETFDLPVVFMHTPSRLLSAEAAVVFFNVLGIGLLLSALLRVEIRRAVVIGLMIAAALALKMLFAGMLGKPQGVWAWMTPGATLGLLLGAILLSGLLAFGHAARLIAAMLCIVLALMAINLAPDNPYFSLPPQLTSGIASHFLSFSSILRALSELWPLLALMWLAAAWWHQRRSNPL
jgi:VanZ family protein